MAGWAVLVAVGVVAVAEVRPAAGVAEGAVLGEAVAAGGDGGAVPGRELVGLRTARSRSYVTAGGERVARVFASPVNYRDAGGRWREIDNELVPVAGGGYRNRANAYRATLPADAGDPVRFELDGAWVQFGLAGAAGEGEAAGAVVRYPGAIAGVTPAFEAQSQGLKETLTLASVEAPAVFRYSLGMAAGLRVRENAAGGIDVRDAQGRLVFAFAAPFMYDAAGAYSDAVSLALTEDRTGMVLRADPGWLADEEREFPVVVDPTVSYPANNSERISGATTDCTIASGTAADTSDCASGTLRVGWDGSRDHRGLVKFDLDGVVPADAVIRNAVMGAHHESVSGTVGQAWVDLHRVTRSWTDAVSWNRYDGTNAWSTVGGDYVAGASDESLPGHAGMPGWYLWDGAGMTSLVQGWVDGSHPNHGVVLRLRNEGGTDDALFSLTSTEGSATGGAHLDVFYRHQTGMREQYTFESMQLSDRHSLHVNVANGNLLVQAQDLRIPGTGLDLELTRTYNHLPTSENLELHKGWRYGTGGHVFIERRPNGDVFFDGPTGYQVTFQQRPDGSYASPPGLDAELTLASDSATIELLRSEETLHFNEHDVLARHEDRNGNAIRFSYATADPRRLESITDTQGRQTTFSYVQRSCTYAPNTVLSQITDPAGRTYSFDYDSGCLLTGYTDPDGKRTEYYYAGGQLHSITDPLGHQTKIWYDAQGRVFQVRRINDPATGAGDSRFFYYYDAPNALCDGSEHVRETIVGDPRGYFTKYCSDQQLRVTKVRDQQTHVRRTEYTSNSNVDLYTAASGAETDAAYDSTNRLTSITAPASGSNQAAKTTFSYGNSSFRPDSSTDPQGNALSYSYTNGNLSEVKENGSANPQVSIDYNDGETGESDDGTVASSTDGNGNTTRYEYDTAGNVIEIDPPSGSGRGSTIITYDTSLSRVASITDGKGQKRVFSYDPLDRVTEIKIYDTSGTLVQTQTYGYDANGNRLTRSDASGQYSYVYDAQNRLIEEHRPGQLTSFYSYDPIGNLATFTHAGEQIAYSYHPDNTVATITEPGGHVTSFAYNDDNSRNHTALPNGVVQTINFDRAERPTRIRAVHGTDVLTDFEYDYTATVGGTSTERQLRSELTDHVRGTTTSYDYDTLNRLIEADTAGAVSDTFSYQYDNASNRTRVTRNGSTESFGYGTGNQLCWRASGTSSAGCGSPPSGATSYQHDLNGNLIGSSDGLQIAYNQLDQMISYQYGTGGATHTFAYAGATQDERVAKDTTGYATSPLGLTSETTGTATTRYLRDPAGQLTARRSPNGAGTDRHYYLQDALGSIAAITNDSGDLVTRYTYNDPYGNDITVSGSLQTDPYRFAGEYFDSETGLYKIGARYYAPGQGRWTQPDPINQAFDPRQANRYTFVAGDPLNLVDTTGLHGCPSTPWLGTSSCDTPRYGDVPLYDYCLPAGLLAIPAGRALGYVMRSGPGTPRTQFVAGCLGALGFSAGSAVRRTGGG